MKSDCPDCHGELKPFFIDDRGNEPDGYQCSNPDCTHLEFIKKPQCFGVYLSTCKGQDKCPFFNECYANFVR